MGKVKFVRSYCFRTLVGPHWSSGSRIGPLSCQKGQGIRTRKVISYAFSCSPQLDKTLLKIVTTIVCMYGELSVNKPLFTLFTSCRPMKR